MAKTPVKKKKASPLKGRTLSKAHKTAISEALKASWARRKKGSKATKKGKALKATAKKLVDKRYRHLQIALRNAKKDLTFWAGQLKKPTHKNRTTAADRKLKVQKLKKQIKDIQESLKLYKG